MSDRKVLGVAMLVVFCIVNTIVSSVGHEAREQAYEQRRHTERAFEQNEKMCNDAWSECLLILDQVNQWEQGARPRKVLERAHEQAVEHAKQWDEQLVLVEQAAQQAKQASIMAYAQGSHQARWGLGAGLLADVLLLVGALAWLKLTAKTEKDKADKAKRTADEAQRLADGAKKRTADEDKRTAVQRTAWGAVRTPAERTADEAQRLADEAKNWLADFTGANKAKRKQRP